MISKLVVFLLINFAALAIGGLFTSKGVPSDWYDSLQKAPWTPPGWMFGAAWTTIMVCFAFYMSYALADTKRIQLLLGLFAVQWILNVAWNPTFFYFQNTVAGLLLICLLTLLVSFILITFWSDLKIRSLLLLPYLIWLIIATSLNAYIVVKN